MKFISLDNLTQIFTLIKSKFFSKDEATEVQTIGVDTEVTEDSNNLVTSGAVANALDIINTPTMTIEVSQVISQEPLQIQLNEEQYTIIENAKGNILFDLTQLGLGASSCAIGLDYEGNLIVTAVSSSWLDDITEIGATVGLYDKDTHIITIMQGFVPVDVYTKDEVDDLVSSQQSTFIAQYNVTSFSDIYSAYTNNKIVYCKYDNDIYELSSCTTTSASFILSKIVSGVVIVYDVSVTKMGSSDIWTNRTKSIQNLLVAGDNITINPLTNTISASGGGTIDAYTKAQSDTNFFNKTTNLSNPEIVKRKIQVGDVSTSLNNAFLHMRKLDSGSITGFKVNGACFSVNADGTASFQHKTYSDSGTNGKNSAILRFSNKGIQFAINPKSSGSPDETDYHDVVTSNNYEEWTFVLEDGTEVTKKVIIV